MYDSCGISNADLDESMKSKCCQHCNRSTLIDYNGLKSKIKWQLPEIPYLVKELSKEPFFKLFPKRQILDRPILKEFADDNFKFDQKGRKFTPMRIENTVGKGEIAGYEQPLLSQCFQKT